MKKIALIQTESKGLSQSMAIIEHVLKETTDAHLCLFGAKFLNGELSFQYRTDIDCALSLKSEEIVRLQMWARQFGCGIGFGFYENDKGGIYSSYLVIGMEGEIIAHAKQRSILWKPTGACADYREGHRTETFWWKGKKMAIILSEDLGDDTLLPDLLDLEDQVDYFLCALTSKYGSFSKRTEIFCKPCPVTMTGVTDEPIGEYQFGKRIEDQSYIVKNL